MLLPFQLVHFQFINQPSQTLAKQSLKHWLEAFHLIVVADHLVTGEMADIVIFSMLAYLAHKEKHTPVHLLVNVPTSMK
jgi:hypothetical protein